VINYLLRFSMVRRNDYEVHLHSNTLKVCLYIGAEEKISILLGMKFLIKSYPESYVSLHLTDLKVLLQQMRIS